MLEFEIHADDLTKRWMPQGTAWCAGRSVIAAYRNPALHATMITTARRTAVIVRERIRGATLAPDTVTPRQCTEREFDHLLREARQWPLEFALLTLTHGDPQGVPETQGVSGTLNLLAGRWGTAPIYLHADDRVLRGHWDATELYPYLRSTALDPGFAARYLVELDLPYSRRTIFPEISMLTERALATWSSPFKLPKIRYPRDEDHASAMRVKPGANLEGAIQEILAASMRRWLRSDDDEIAVELSGGLDSATVAAAAAALTRRPVRSYGMMMPDQPGLWQRGRREAIIRAFGMQDRHFPCTDEPPFNPRSRRVRDGTTVPWGEFYDEAVGRLLQLARKDGISQIFTGMGGDELSSFQFGELDDDEIAASPSALTDDAQDGFPGFLTTQTTDAFEQPEAAIDPAPQSLLYTSTLESAAAVSTLYLTHGVWPVSPLLTPELVEFFRRLPYRLRRGRTMQRRLLTSYGLGKTVAYPNPKRLEDFTGVMRFAMLKASVPVIVPLFEQSRLAEQGFVDRGKMIDAYRTARNAGADYPVELLGAAVLELTLQAVERRRSSAGGSLRRAALA